MDINSFSRIDEKDWVFHGLQETYVIGFTNYSMALVVISIDAISP